MTITGHKNGQRVPPLPIVNEDDIRAALERVQNGNAARKVVRLQPAASAVAG